MMGKGRCGVLVVAVGRGQNLKLSLPLMEAESITLVNLEVGSISYAKVGSVPPLPFSLSFSHFVQVYKCACSFSNDRIAIVTPLPQRRK